MMTKFKRTEGDGSIEETTQSRLFCKNLLNVVD